MTPDRQPDIAKRAYEFWEMEGRPHGRTLDHWLRAEVELKSPEPAPQAPIVAAPRARAPQRAKPKR